MPETTKTFDCVQMKRDIQAAVFEETKALTPAELVEYFRRKSDTRAPGSSLTTPEKGITSDRMGESGNKRRTDAA